MALNVILCNRFRFQVDVRYSLFNTLNWVHSHYEVVCFTFFLLIPERTSKLRGLGIYACISLRVSRAALMIVYKCMQNRLNYQLTLSCFAIKMFSPTPPSPRCHPVTSRRTISVEKPADTPL